ncbi:MAG: HD domain-containing protein [Nitrospiraceae bacterium]|nr:HD domain-containing protein [Nitrospiraceae bacterium]
MKIKEYEKKFKFEITFIKNVKDAIHGYISLTSLEVFIVDSPIFQRLRGISQVPFGFMVYPSHSVKRFEHSIGTMHLAGRFIETVLRNTDIDTKIAYFKEFIEDIKKTVLNTGVGKNDILNFLQESAIAIAFDSNDIESLIRDNKEFSESLKNVAIQLTRIMGLLHDIGHPPFSHLGEEIIESIINEIDDEDKGTFIEKIAPLYSLIKNSYPTEINNKTQLPKIPIHELNTFHIASTLLKEYAVKNLSNDSNKLKELIFYLCLFKKAINKLEKQNYRAFRTLLGIIDNDIDVDRADYFLRDGITSGIGFGSYDLERLVNSMVLVKTNDDFIIRPNTSAVSAVETFITERSKLHRWLYFHPLVILFETCFLNLLKLIVKEYKDYKILELFYTPISYDVIPLSFIHPEADVITRIKNHYLTIREKSTQEPKDKFFLTLYDVIFFKSKSCRPLWQKQGDYYINFHAKIIAIARERKMQKSKFEVIDKHIHEYFRDSAKNLDRRKKAIEILEGILDSKYRVMIASKRFKSIKTMPTDATGAPDQYVIVGKDFQLIGIDEYPAIRAIEETWYKEIPIHIFIISNDGSEIVRKQRDEIRKKIEEFFLDNSNRSDFSFEKLKNFNG